MKLIHALSFSLLCLSVVANDGSYYTNGTTLVPRQETTIEMHREVLSFDCRNGIASVDVYFEFNNPEDSAIHLQVGFVAPLAGGDLGLKEFYSKRIEDFIVQVDGRILPYKLKAAECSDCPLEDTSAVKFHGYPTHHFVYLFNVEFDPGITVVRHSYNFPASVRVGIRELYRYTLTTGNKWANGTIEDFTLNVKMDPYKGFYITDVFGENATWEIHGTGNELRDPYDVKFADLRKFKLLSGSISIHSTNFSPEKDFEIGAEPYFISDLPDGLSHKGFYALRYGLDDSYVSDTEFSQRELLMMKNMIYAQYGYPFRNKKLREIFEEMQWYIPDPNLSMNDVPLTQKEHTIIAQIIQREQLLTEAKRP